MIKNSCLLAGLLAAALLSAVFAQELTVNGRADLRDRFVLTKTEAVGLMPADLVAGPDVKQLYWSPHGRYILVEQLFERAGASPGAGNELRLSGYDRRTRISDVVWRYAAERASVGEVAWLVGTDIALVTVSEQQPPTAGTMEPLEQSRLLRIIAPSASARPVPGTESPDGITVHVWPNRPYALIERIPLTRAIPPEVRETAPRPQGVLHLLKATGGLGPAIDLPAAGWTTVFWSADGMPYLSHTLRGADRKLRRTTYALDVVTGKTRQLDNPPPINVIDKETKVASSPGAVRLKEASSSLAEGTVSQRVRPLWLETPEASDQPRALVSADSSWSALSPKGDGVLYIANRSAWVAPLIRLSRSKFDGLIRQAAMQDAKHVGLALAMYTQDYDEKFPLSDHFTGGAVYPYMKDKGVAEGFNYQYPGENLKDVQKPSEMSMGYISGPGGRAVVYVDGHVKWVPDQK
jgi:hypothetical protein